MRLLLAVAWVIFVFPAHAASALHMSHLQHVYAGGGGCAEMFLLYWDDLESEISDVALLVEVSSKGQRSMTETLRVERLGFTTADNKDQASFETPQCLSGKPRLTVRAASGVIHGARVDLLRSKTLQIGKVETFPLSISGPTHHFTGPARKSAQAGEFKRYAQKTPRGETECSYDLPPIAVPI